MASKKKTERKRSNEMKKKQTNNKTPLIAIIVLIGIIVIAAGVYLIMNQPSDDGTTDGNTNDSTGNPIAVIDTSKGIVKVELYLDKVPNTVNNFIDYVDSYFYNGLVFHRVANLDPSQPDTHIIQGGGFYPNGTRKETNDPIDLEINSDARHVDGAIAMARTSDPNSATSQFYICDGPESFLDDDYAVFGIVIDGMDVVQSIALVETTTKYGMTNWPVNDVIINNITIQE